MVFLLEFICPGVHFWSMDVQFSNADDFLVASIIGLRAQLILCVEMAQFSEIATEDYQA